jgi:hypothetical protein
MKSKDRFDLEPSDEDTVRIMERTLAEIPDNKLEQAKAFRGVKRLWQDGKISKKEAMKCYLKGEIKPEIVDKLNL